MYKISNVEPVINYPYLFQTSGYSDIDDIRAELESQRDWDFVSSEPESRLVQTIAARKFINLGPLNDEQKALRNYLITQKAGLNISTYAWGLYVNAKAPQRQYA